MCFLCHRLKLGKIFSPLWRIRMCSDSIVPFLVMLLPVLGRRISSDQLLRVKDSVSYIPGAVTWVVWLWVNFRVSSNLENSHKCPANYKDLDPISPASFHQQSKFTFWSRFPKARQESRVHSFMKLHSIGRTYPKFSLDDLKKKLNSLGATMISQQKNAWTFGWWFQIFFMFIPIWGNFLRWVETTIKSHSSWSHLKPSSDEVLMPCAAEWLGEPCGGSTYTEVIDTPRMKKKCSLFRVFEWSCGYFALGSPYTLVTVTTRITTFSGSGIPS